MQVHVVSFVCVAMSQCLMCMLQVRTYTCYHNFQSKCLTYSCTCSVCKYSFVCRKVKCHTCYVSIIMYVPAVTTLQSQYLMQKMCVASTYTHAVTPLYVLQCKMSQTKKILLLSVASMHVRTYMLSLLCVARFCKKHAIYVVCCKVQCWSPY